MTLYAGYQVGLAIGEVGEVPNYTELKGMHECRWQILHGMQEIDAIREHNWLKLSEVVRRSLQIHCRLYATSHTAQARIRTAVLEAQPIRAKLQLADGAELEGLMQVERYEEQGREDEMLEVEVTLVSSDVVTVTVS